MPPLRTSLLAVALTLGAALSAASAAPLDKSGEATEHPLDWLIGEWQAEFRPHGDDTSAPTMRFEWGDENRSILTMYGTKPGPGGRLVPEYETTVVWHPVRQRHVFLGAYLSGDRRVTEDGEVEILDDGGVRLHMNVHYPRGAQVPFTDGVVAGDEGHTLEFQRTFHQAGPDELRGFFRIRREGRWEDPHPDFSVDTGYPWRRVEPATEPTAELAPPPAWVLEHWAALAGRWEADNSAYSSETELADAYGMEWSLGIGGRSISGRLFGIEDGEDTSDFWEFREFWQPARKQVVTEQFGADGTYGVGTQTRNPDGSLELEQTFYFVASGVTARTGHRGTLEGDVHTTASFDIDEHGVWTPRRTYVWRRQATRSSEI